ncbi:regulatory protein, luxR family [Lentzea waywayandensis]|uniref:Regulatory protein, luxR family n=1 Tax=Lentzea waywayandensis TaxID=84724 RepID=A0A1I6FFK1_9PSEU|nr:helix-turn-helix transcriptional regulator [Lentzea waywayandensis]SFR28710.1 regulatory protein, luxR family [Lentzea waywayandensis]
MLDERTARAVQLTNRGVDRVTAVALARDVLRSNPSARDTHHCFLVLAHAGEVAEPPTHHTAAARASALIDAGQHDEALEVLLSPDESAEHFFARGRLNQEQGHHDRAYADFTAAGRAAEASGVTNPAVLPWRSAAALSAHDAGRPVVARSLAESALVAARRWGASPAVGRALHAVALTGDPARAVDRLTTAVHLLSASGACVLPARHSLAQALATQGRHAEAARTCATTHTIARQLGNPLWIQRTSELGERLDRLSLLTPQESRSAVLACAMSNREVAAELGVTTRTVELHLSQVYRKLHVKGRRELNRVILRLGVTPP